MVSELEARVKEDFKRARMREFIQRIKNVGKKERNELLSLEYVRNMLKPENETYIGLQEIPVSKIIGSEGRFQDFNKQFLPKYNFLEDRWKSVDKAYHSDIILPPISVYKIGDYFFIRDGNHRISVAAAQGMYYVDAEVVELNTKIPLTEEMTSKDLKTQVIKYEKQLFYSEFDITKIIDPFFLNFTSVGCYEKIVIHIIEHRFYMDEFSEVDSSLEVAITSWYENLFLPIIEAVQENNLLENFPDRTYGDFYLWAIKHWDTLKKENEDSEIDIKDAALDYSEKFAEVDGVESSVAAKKPMKKIYEKLIGKILK